MSMLDSDNDVITCLL